VELAEKIYTMKQLFNTRLGVNRKDDALPKRFMEIPRMGNRTVNIEQALTEYYKLRGWDENGVPTAERMRELNIKSIKSIAKSPRKLGRP